MQLPKNYSFDEITIGQSEEFQITLTEEMVSDFSRLSGDENPLHMDDAFAQKTVFKKRVVHGQLAVSFISRLIGMYLPGTHALYLSQNTLFRRPMFIGMKIMIKGTVIQKVDATKTIVMKTEITDVGNDNLLIDGEAMVNVTK